MRHCAQQAADTPATGAHLAKMEIRALLNELVPRLEHVELAGRPELTSTLSVGGLKHVPLTYEVSA